jgi:hypothetical protein
VNEDSGIKPTDPYTMVETSGQYPTREEAIAALHSRRDELMRQGWKDRTDYMLGEGRVFLKRGEQTCDLRIW